MCLSASSRGRTSVEIQGKRERMTIHWKDRSIREWIVRERPSWAFDVIRSWDTDAKEHRPNWEVFKTEIVHANAEIDPTRIVGQWDHYSGQTWWDAFWEPKYKVGKMRAVERQSDENPLYYFQSGMHDISFDTFDGGRRWYSRQGNHRTVIGKFLLAMAHAKTGTLAHFPIVPVTYFSSDEPTFSAFHSLLACIEENQLLIHVDARSITLANLQVNGSQRTIKEPYIFVSDGRLSNLGQAARMDPVTFGRYASWVIESRGRLKLRERLTSMFFGSGDEVIRVPGFGSCHNRVLSDYVSQRQKARGFPVNLNLNPVWLH